ncbi:MAG: acyl-CoA thioesterase, partial [Acidimicrobiales bacterium]
GEPGLREPGQLDRIRDGRSFTTRRVVAIQHGRAIFNLQSSFQKVETGLDFQQQMPLNVPDPESLPTWQERMEPLRDKMGAYFDRPRPIDLRWVDTSPPGTHREKADSQLVWLRADGKLPDDPALQACVVTYASDMTLLDTVVLPHGVDWTESNIMMASLDHAMWFHRPFRADEWMLFQQTTPSSSGSRGLATGEIFTASGELVVSVVQEGLVRIIDQAKRR